MILPAINIPFLLSSSIWLTSAVTVLSSNDPVRAYQSFSTLDSIGNFRAELLLKTRASEKVT